MSASLAAVPVNVCTTPEATSTPICAFMPKCHSLPFLVWCISGSRALLLFLVEGGAAIYRGVDNRPLPHQQPAFFKRRPDLIEQHLRQIVPFQPVAEIHHGRRV